MNSKKRRSGIQVMAGLIGMITPLLGYMFIAILMGCIGNLMATFITILGGYGFLGVFGAKEGVNLTLIFALLIAFAVLRGILRYAEQACNHFIAFKLLARIRHKVFAALRKLAPAKLDGSEKGNLISIITSDIELLEVFYAHTISPVLIAFSMLIIMCFVFGHFSFILSIYALLAYMTIGVFLPMYTHMQASNLGNKIRNESGSLSSFVLETLRGQREIIQYNAFDSKMKELNRRGEQLSKDEKQMKQVTAKNSALTSTLVTSLSIGMILLSAVLFNMNILTGEEVIIVSVMMFSSFSPFIALSALSSTIQPTIASAQRVLALLDETPLIEENIEGEIIESTKIHADNISFKYEDELILNNVNLEINPNEVIGIVGKSGSGKSTLLKLMMRFWEAQKGSLKIDDSDVKEIKTSSLRKHISYMTQSTHLFHDSILNNIKVSKLNATDEEVIEACKKANIHEFILSLPKGYETPVSECGDSLSGGEKQRIGLARAFLHDADLVLLDEPTSNLDSLNEKMILKSLNNQKENKTICLVSHRLSTINWCDRIINMDQGRVS